MDKNDFKNIITENIYKSKNANNRFKVQSFPFVIYYYFDKTKIKNDDDINNYFKIWSPKYYKELDVLMKSNNKSKFKPYFDLLVKYGRLMYEFGVIIDIYVYRKKFIWNKKYDDKLKNKEQQTNKSININNKENEKSYNTNKEKNKNNTNENDDDEMIE